MNRSGKCNELTLNVGNVTAAVKQHYINALEKASDRLLDLMRKEVLETVWGDGPGKPGWRKDISSMLRVVYKDVADHYLECGIGLPDGVAHHILVRAMVIAHGAGIAAGNPWIKAGPPGREVWDSDLSGKKESTAETEYALPVEFNQMGNFFVENAILQMRKHFQDVLDQASEELPESIFFKNVNVRQR